MLNEKLCDCPKDFEGNSIKNDLTQEQMARLQQLSETLTVDTGLANHDCERCLISIVNHQINQAIEENSLEHNLALANQFARKKELIEGLDYYIENGFYVFTEWFHLKRGECCKNRCRHCPYGTFSTK